jgi:hypothetical protein
VPARCQRIVLGHDFAVPGARRPAGISGDNAIALGACRRQRTPTRETEDSQRTRHYCQSKTRGRRSGGATHTHTKHTHDHAPAQATLTQAPPRGKTDPTSHAGHRPAVMWSCMKTRRCDSGCPRLFSDHALCSSSTWLPLSPPLARTRSVEAHSVGTQLVRNLSTSRGGLTRQSC